MIRSIGVGRVRASTSPGSSCREIKGRKRLISVMAKESSTASNAPRKSVIKAVRSNFSSPTTDASPMPMMGDIKGATSIAPMMTAAELVTSPEVAMAQDSTTSRKKSKPGEEVCLISIRISLRSSAVSGLTILRNEDNTLIHLPELDNDVILPVNGKTYFDKTLIAFIVMHVLADIKYQRSANLAVEPGLSRSSHP